MFRIASVFSSNMVLQRGKNVNVWGEADNCTTITVEINGTKAHAAAADGKWRVVLPPMPAGGPYEMDVFSSAVKDGKEIKESIRFYNVMIGEVWLCGGQ